MGLLSVESQILADLTFYHGDHGRNSNLVDFEILPDRTLYQPDINFNLMNSEYVTIDYNPNKEALTPGLSRIEKI